MARITGTSITALDEQVGRLRGALRDLGAADDTMLWFCSDNGPEGGAKSPGSAGEFRGRKRALYEGGVRVPGLLEWPAVIKEPRTTAFAAVTSDYLPTTLAVLEMSRPQHPLDGVNLLPVIHGEMDQRAAPLGFQSKGNVVWHEGAMKLVYTEKTPEKLELYDLEKDPSESKNLAADQPDKALAMKKAALAWQASCARSSEGHDYEK
jgi:arylsulfatase A-like enzyme